jgi:hypothetical protein
MKCDEIQILLSDLVLGTTAQEHVKQCTECRKYRQDIEGIMKNPHTYETSEELDNSVLNFARQNRPVKKSPIPFYVWGVLAAAALLILGFVIQKQQAKPQSDDGVVKQETPNKIEQAPIVVDQNVREIPNDENNLANAETLAETSAEDDISDILEDSFLDTELSALEGELFVLSSELDGGKL